MRGSHRTSRRGLLRPSYMAFCGFGGDRGYCGRRSVASPSSHLNRDNSTSSGYDFCAIYRIISRKSAIWRERKGFDARCLLSLESCNSVSKIHTLAGIFYKISANIGGLVWALTSLQLSYCAFCQFGSKFFNSFPPGPIYPSAVFFVITVDPEK
jgi:hypothetical protein